jgi:hypothetical protein
MQCDTYPIIRSVHSNVRDYFSAITLSAAEQVRGHGGSGRRGLGGGKVYDLLTLKCAAKSGAERVYALNLPEFTRLAPSELREKVGTVS